MKTLLKFDIKADDEIIKLYKKTKSTGATFGIRIENKLTGIEEEFTQDSIKAAMEKFTNIVNNKPVDSNWTNDNIKVILQLRKEAHHEH